MKIAFAPWLVVVALAAIRLVVVPPSGDGIVALPDFPQAVVLCGEATIINPGYEDDPRVQELLDLAEDTCPQ